MAFLINRYKEHAKITQTEDGAAKFTSGSTMHHVVSASLISAVGLLALFVVDLVDIFFIGILGEQELAAAVGFSGALGFFTMSIAIASVIAVTATLSQLVGKGDMDSAKRFFVHSVGYALVLSIPSAVLLYVFRDAFLGLMGAQGLTLAYASDYFAITNIGFPIMTVAMVGTAVIRSHGDFKVATLVTLSGGVANAILDPLFIFGFGWGLDGAALATLLSRVTMLGVTFYIVLHRYHFWTWMVSLTSWKQDVRIYVQTFIPAALSNLATPIGSGFVVSQMAVYGVGAVAGMSVVGRITPVLFVVVLALSGAIGPIIGQNYGAQLYDRVRCTVRNAVIFSTVYVVIGSALLWILQGYVSRLFGLSAEGQVVVEFYATFISISFVFVSIIFIMNATFNNIGKPVYATYINLLRNIVFLIPFVYVGGKLGGVEGILIGQAVGVFCVALIALGIMSKTLKKL